MVFLFSYNLNSVSFLFWWYFIPRHTFLSYPYFCFLFLSFSSNFFCTFVLLNWPLLFFWFSLISFYLLRASSYFNFSSLFIIFLCFVCSPCICNFAFHAFFSALPFIFTLACLHLLLLSFNLNYFAFAFLPFCLSSSLVFVYYSFFFVWFRFIP